MMLGADDIGPFEGLVRSTAARYAPYLDDEFDDIAQVLRLKVWQARRSYDPARATQTLEKYVFSCVVNRVKDMLKAQSRRNAARDGGPLYVEDVAASSPAAFEARYFSTGYDVVVEAVVEVEKVELPSTLTVDERRVTVLLLLDMKQTEIALALGISRSRVRAAHAAVREKMADWTPSPSPPVPAPPPERRQLAA